jgi:predicted nucleic acid-binding protein
MFLLDTNVVSELRKAASGRANTGVTNWAKSVPATQQAVITRNTGDFNRFTDLTVSNPWT